jgi:hypothetical protein
MDPWRIFGVVVMGLLAFNLCLLFQLMWMTRPLPRVKNCLDDCTPDKCACWDKEQRYRRADLDRQVTGGENVRDVRLSGSPGADLH